MNFSEIELIARFPFRAREPVLIDVGAHHGFSSMPFANRGWRVIAVEPEPVNRAALEKNLGSSPNVHILPVAVSNTVADNVPFFVSREH